MKTRLLTAMIFCVARLALATEPDSFELHAVAATAGGNTKEYSTPGVDHVRETVLLDTDVLLDHTAIAKASVDHEQGQPVIFIKFTAEGGNRFGEITTKYLNKRVGIVLYGQLYSAPVIRSQILGGSVEISGNFTEDEAKALADKLNQSVSS